MSDWPAYFINGNDGYIYDATQSTNWDITPSAEADEYKGTVDLTLPQPLASLQDNQQ